MRHPRSVQAQAERRAKKLAEAEKVLASKPAKDLAAIKTESGMRPRVDGYLVTRCAVTRCAVARSRPLHLQPIMPGRCRRAATAGGRLGAAPLHSLRHAWPDGRPMDARLNDARRLAECQCGEVQGGLRRDCPGPSESPQRSEVCDGYSPSL